MSGHVFTVYPRTTCLLKMGAILRVMSVARRNKSRSKSSGLVFKYCFLYILCVKTDLLYCVCGVCLLCVLIFTANYGLCVCTLKCLFIVEQQMEMRLKYSN